MRLVPASSWPLEESSGISNNKRTPRGLVKRRKLMNGVGPRSVLRMVVTEYGTLPTKRRTTATRSVSMSY
jgi:hypothetical protein